MCPYPDVRGGELAWLPILLLPLALPPALALRCLSLRLSRSPVVAQHPTFRRLHWEGGCRVLGRQAGVPGLQPTAQVPLRRCGTCPYPPAPGPAPTPLPTHPHAHPPTHLPAEWHRQVHTRGLPGQVLRLCLPECLRG